MNSETVGLIAVALISTIGGVQIALINRTRQHAKTAANQLENEHVTDPSKVSNIREDITHNQGETNKKLDMVIAQQFRMNNKVDRLFSITNTHTNQIDEITHDRKTVDQIRKSNE